MFNMKKNAGAIGGYQLRINYNSETDVYYLLGFRSKIIGQITLDQDGAALEFNSLEEVLEYIKNYQSE